MSMRLHLCIVLGLFVVSHADLAGQDGGADASNSNWPREIQGERALVVVYQPQPEKFKGDELTGRAAVSVTMKGTTEPVFGAVWMVARVSTDRDARTVRMLEVEVPRVHFADAKPEQIGQLESLVARELPKADLDLDLDRLLTTLELADKEKRAQHQLGTAPPAIRFSSTRAVLISIDGKPQLRPVDDTDLMRVVNTPYFIVLHPASGRYYLEAGRDWFSAEELSGAWRDSPEAPREVVAAAKKLAPDEGVDTPPANDRKPKIIVVTKPTELISTDGAPTYTPIEGTKLLAIDNTQSRVFVDIASQKRFLVIGGRWFTAAKLEGPWTFVAAKDLPADFGKIPPDSEFADVRPFVAGTHEATDAVLDTYIPQTGAVDRGKVITVTYDGTPVFEPIEGTGMRYAFNTRFRVIEVADKFYCCEKAVWYVADNALGPWAVATSVSDAIYTIPPSSPVYNITFVRVYRSTPSVVYVGYTPGYVGAYVHGTTVVYGTGYVYPAYVGAVVYYPVPVTYGYPVAYHPATGFAFAAGFVAGAWLRTARWGGWYGGRRYTSVNVNRNVNVNVNHNNFYGGNRPGNRPANRPQSQRPRRPNNVYAGRDGSVHRRTDSGWQSHEGGQWRNSGASRSRMSSSGLERDFGSRQRGASRSRGFGGFGGGGRRR